MRIGKTIGGKLYWGFGGILVVVVFLSLLDLIAVRHEQTTKDMYKTAIAMARQMSTLNHDIMNNRLHLRNFLLNGDSRESDLLTKGGEEVDKQLTTIEETTSLLSQDRERAKELLETVRAAEKDWMANFAAPLMDKRRQVDGGSATVAELQIAYLQANPDQEQKKEEEPIMDLDKIIKAAVIDADKSDRAASMGIYIATSLGVILMLALGGGIAWKVAKSITAPLSQLITVAGQIADAGDLDQQVEISGEDEETGEVYTPDWPNPVRRGGVWKARQVAHWIGETETPELNYSVWANGTWG